MTRIITNTLPQALPRRTLTGPDDNSIKEKLHFNSYSRHPKKPQSKQFATNVLVNTLLRLMALQFNHRSKYRRWMQSIDGWINFGVGIRSRDNSVQQSIIFAEGHVTVHWGMDQAIDTCLVFRTPRDVIDLVKVTPDEAMNMLVENKMNTEGNLAYMNLFNLYLNLLMGKKQQKHVNKRVAADRNRKLKEAMPSKEALKHEHKERQTSCLCCRRIDPGVKHLKDTFLPQYTIDDFPRVKAFHEQAFSLTPKICHERPLLLTQWHRRNGFETNNSGHAWIPERRQAEALKYLLENRKAIIWENDLLAGTSGTSKITPLIYPDAAAHTIWGELLSCREREIVPYVITDETIDVLHKDVFPYWAKRNIREWVREENDNPLCGRIDEHLAAYIVWKTIGMSETIPDFKKIITSGTLNIIQEIRQQLQQTNSKDNDKAHTLKAMITSLEGINAYARHLSEEALNQSRKEPNAKRQGELEKLHDILTRIPQQPAKTLHEAIQTTWILKVALNMENSNDGLGYGRLDQLYQPYFEQDLKQIQTEQEKEDYIKQAIELIACLFLKSTDHLTLNPDIANHLFGGSPPSQTITVGGVTPDGSDAVNDMTYIILKVTEMLRLNDPNINARYHEGINSPEYLRRCNDVNYITGATPAIHNDIAMIKALSQHDYDIKDIRDWSATGCVEPTLCGKHAGHTSAINISIVTALEMALNNGYHPLMGWELGPETGSVEKNAFPTFDDFFRAFETQFTFLINQSIDYNNLCGSIYQKVRPSNLISVFTQGCITSGKTVVNGGAKYNSSGATCIGLADVTDSMMVIKNLVYEQQRVSFSALKKAIDNNFEGYESLRALATSKVPFFGSGNADAVKMANRIAKLAHDTYGARLNYRGGHHHTGFWSMSSHAAYGRLSGALPSGRLAGKPFTPGLTPEPNASKNLLDNLRDVAELDPTNLDNNIAFNVKIVPSPNDSHEQIVDHIYAYTQTYFHLGGTQMQMNAVSTEMMRDAMAHPENYRQLLVRISGYCAYFTQLDEQAQLELIERAEYSL